MLRSLTFILGLLMATQAVAEGLFPTRPPPRRQTIEKFDPIPTKQEYSWTGLYFGVGAGYEIGINELDYIAGGLSVANVDSLATRGFTADPRLGYDFHLPNTVLVFGILGGYNFGEADFDARFGPKVLGATIDPNWYVGLRAGYMLRNTSLLYVGYIYQWADLDIAGTGFAPIHRDLGGHGPIAGLEVPISPFISLSGEYSYVRYDDVVLWAGGVNRLDLDADSHTFKARLTFRTGPLFQ